MTLGRGGQVLSLVAWARIHQGSNVNRLITYVWVQLCRPLFWTYPSTNRSKTLEASTLDILFKCGLCLLANQEPTYSSRATLQAWPGDIDMETHEQGGSTIQLPLLPIQVHDLLDSIHYACWSGNFIMGCGWTHRSDSALLGILYPHDTVRTWCPAQFVYWFSSYAIIWPNDIRDYEIHAPGDMRGLNCKIPRIYLKPSYMWTGGCRCSMEEIRRSVATSAAFFASTHEIDLAATFQSLFASLWSPLQHFVGDCVKTWLGTLVHILIDMDFKQQLHGNLNSHLQSLGCVKAFSLQHITRHLVVAKQQIPVYWTVQVLRMFAQHVSALPGAHVNENGTA